MKYLITKDKIEIFDKSEFNIAHILECGQIFTYEKQGNSYAVFSNDKKAVLTEDESKIVISTKDTAYFENFFDLKTDYSLIKNTLASKFNFLIPMLEYGSGIRILKQDKLETLVGFIISANNNIKRIMASMQFLREKLGKKIEDYYAFPTLDKLTECDEEFFVAAGLGYRAKQIVKALFATKQIDLESLETLSTSKLKEKLLTICGVGSKVADCVMLFAYGRQDVFPVDTWIEKVYHECFDSSCQNRDVMRENLVQKFGNLAGYAQQYMFYFKRTSK